MLSDIFLALGIALLAAGFWMFHPGAGLIVAGLGFLSVAVLLVPGGDKAARRNRRGD